MGFKSVVIELFSSIPGVDFSKCYPNRVHVDIDGSPIPFIGLEDLKKNKAASGLTKDKLDLEELP